MSDLHAHYRAMLPTARMDALKPDTSLPTTAVTEGLFNVAAMIWLILWYLSSFLTLFMNKHTLDAFHAEPFMFSTIQMLVSTVFGAIHMRHPCYMGRASKEWIQRPMTFYTSMTFVGITRFLVVFLSLLSLEYVAVSFTETVKSSAPLFTVFISWLVLREQNGVYVLLSLVPIMTGLALCSAYELSFTMIGFLAALGTNIAECLQFVLSKQSLSNLVCRTTPAEFQFYSCFASVIMQIPICLLLMDYTLAAQTSLPGLVWMVLNGFVYHIQSMTSWVLMEYVSPVTHSVCNTVKRAIAIWLSVLVYGNKVTLLGGLGTVVVIAGVLAYNKARHYEQVLHARQLALSRSMGLENGARLISVRQNL